MIRKSIITAAILLLLHSFFIRTNNYVGYGSQQQWQDNTIKAQNYLYDNSHQINYVIVGSSLSCKLRKDSLKEFYNLSFAGKSIYDGFEVIAKKKISPKYLFIEMNFVLRSGSENFTSAIVSDIPYYLKEHLPSLRDEYEPTCMLGNKIVVPCIESVMGSLKPESPNPVGTDGEVQSKDVFKKMMDIQLKLYNSDPADSTIENKMKAMKNWISIFQKRNMKIVFYEMPVDGSLKNLVRARRVREAFYSNFPPSQFLYLPDTDCTTLTTRDGIHLDTKSAKFFSGFFAREALRLIASDKKIIKQ